VLPITGGGGTVFGIRRLFGVLALGMLLLSPMQLREAQGACAQMVEAAPSKQTPMHNAALRSILITTS
jgi:hypothetical protein